MTKHDWKVGDWAVISSRTNGALSSLLIGSHVKINGFDGDRCGVEFSTGFRMALEPIDLKPLPTETPKDPFAPGEYVTCVVAEGFHGKGKGDVLLVDGYTHPDKDWFCSLGWNGGAGRMEALGFQKGCFRPATPEEIAAYKAKYEAEPVVDPQPKTYTLTPYIKPETIMLHGVEYLVTENM